MSKGIIVLLLCLPFFGGCLNIVDDKKIINKIDEDAVSLSKQIEAEKIPYILMDYSRSKGNQLIGTIYTRASIKVGDLVFLGDDIYTVTFAKISSFKPKNGETMPDSFKSIGADEEHYFVIDHIELVVNFYRKAEKVMVTM